MTAQISDTVFYKGEEYALIGAMGYGLFHPSAVGMEPEMLHTACYQGFYCAYEVIDDKIYLMDLHVRDRNNHYPPVNGVAANTTTRPAYSWDENGERVRQEVDWTESHYSDIRLPIERTGKIRIARDLVQGLYINMGFQKATAFRTVLDLTLFKGTVSHVNDRSAEMETKRGEFKKEYETGDIWDTTRKAFLMDMDLE